MSGLNSYSLADAPVVCSITIPASASAIRMRTDHVGNPAYVGEVTEGFDVSLLQVSH